MVREEGNVFTKGFITSSLGFSGSLTKLTDGTSYLAAGSNVTIASASNGQVVISSTAPGTPGGSDTQLQFNSGSSFGGISGATTDGSAVTFGDSAILIGQDITHAGDTDTKITFGDDAIGFTAGGEQLLTISEAGTDLVTVGDGGDVDFRVRTNNDDNTLYVVGSTDRVGIGLNGPATTLHLKDSDVAIRLQRENNSEASTIEFAGSAGNIGASIAHDVVGNDLVFDVFNGTTTEESLRLGGYASSENRQVIILSGSGMGAGAMQPRQAADIAFFVSGSVDSRGTAVKGTAVFGGDVHISGSITSDGTSLVNGSGASNRVAIWSDGDTVSSNADLTFDGSTLNVGGTNGVSIADGEISIKNAGAQSYVRFYCESSNAHYAQLQAAPHAEFSDNIILTLPTTTGRILSSTEAKIEEYLYHTDDEDTFLQFEDDKVNISAGGNVGLTLNEGAADKVEIGSNYDQVLILSGGAASSTNPEGFVDTNFFVSGAIGSVNTTTKGTAVFGGDTVVSGALFTHEKRVRKPTRTVLPSTGSIMTLSSSMNFFSVDITAEQSGITANTYDLGVTNGEYDGEEVTLMYTGSLTPSSGTFQTWSSTTDFVKQVRVGYPGAVATLTLQFSTATPSAINGTTLGLQDVSGVLFNFTGSSSTSPASPSFSAADKSITYGVNGISSTDEAATGLVNGISLAISNGMNVAASALGGGTGRVQVTQGDVGTAGNKSISGTAIAGFIIGDIGGSNAFTGGANNPNHANVNYTDALSGGGVYLNYKSPTLRMVWDNSSGKWNVVTYNAVTI
tara:strand:- start:260 stop:2635 length:2376 start_codon:yes stop_codon:yes gene_type:complete